MTNQVDKKKLRTLTVLIQSGDETCAYEFGRMCPYLGTMRLGTDFACRLFPSDDGSFTRLDSNEKGWLKRCDACLKAEKLLE